MRVYCKKILHSLRQIVHLATIAFFLDFSTLCSNLKSLITFVYYIEMVNICPFVNNKSDGHKCVIFSTFHHDKWLVLKCLRLIDFIVDHPVALRHAGTTTIVICISFNSQEIGHFCRLSENLWSCISIFNKPVMVISH